VSDELFKRLEIELELPPGTPVLYEGTWAKCHGLWIVHSHIDDARVTLRSPDDEYTRLNAYKSDLSVVPDAP
jgi:hypothetical protein